jgi:hypothetical protein
MPYNEIVRCRLCEQYHARPYRDCRRALSWEDVVRLYGQQALSDADAEYIESLAAAAIPNPRRGG